MPTTELMGRSLQENILTALAWNDQAGKIIAETLDVGLCEAEYREIAIACIGYWKQHGRAPGVHTADLFAREMEAGGRKANMLRRIFMAMTQLHEGMNTEFVLNQLQEFTQRQLWKSAITKAANVITHDLPLEDAQTAIAEVMHGPIGPKFDPGIRLGDIAGFMEYLAADEENEYSTGIAELDARHVVPARKQVMLLLGMTGAGKSWWLVHLGVIAALRRHKKVLHITLESGLPARAVQMRYMQNLLALPKYDNDLTTTRGKLVVNGENRLVGITAQEITAEIALKGEPREVKQYLERFISYRAALFNNLVVKDFPPNSLSVAALRGYLHGLDATGFTPDILLLDYIGLMNIDPDNYRVNLITIVNELCGLASERNIAVVSAEQSNRDGATAKQIAMEHVAEAWGTLLPVDTVLTFTRSDAEKRHKVARLWVKKNRHGHDEFGVVLAQNYHHGQFVLQTVPRPPLAEYLELLAALDGRG